MEMVKKNQRYTVQDYMTWDNEERWEIINGIAYDMSPAPGIRHQTVSINLAGLIYAKLSGHSCRVFHAPTDVVLSDNDVVQPDLLIVCDPQKITEKNIQGAPDVVFEILSPRTSRKDKREKKQLYESSGVLEYILVDTDGQFVEYFRMQNDKHYQVPEIIDCQEILTLRTLQNLEIPLWEVFGVEKKSEE